MNIFRIFGDMSHLASILVLLLKLRASKSAAGEDFTSSACAVQGRVQKKRGHCLPSCRASALQKRSSSRFVPHFFRDMSEQSRPERACCLEVNARHAELLCRLSLLRYQQPSAEAAVTQCFVLHLLLSGGRICGRFDFVRGRTRTTPPTRPLLLAVANRDARELCYIWG